MRLRDRLAFDGLAVRFAVLLTVALVAATLIAAALLFADRREQDSAVRIEREVERIVSLLPAIEAADPRRRVALARAASTRFSRVTVDAAPIVAAVPAARRSAALTRALRAALPERELRAAIVERDRRDGIRGGGAVALSIRLQGAGGPQWLNSVSRGDRREEAPGIPGDILLLVLAVSLAAVLGVALIFVRRLTRPLNALAAAARAAGQGNREVRVPETGPRELRAASAAFNDMQARIGRFDAERMRTLAAVGHDLRTPITSLRIRAEMLDQEVAAPMIHTLDEMTVMADGLVAYARGAGEGEAVGPIDLAPMLERLCAERGAVFVGGDAAGKTAQVAGRAVALGRAIGNLIDNAIRYGKTARVSLACVEGTAVIAVEDDGPGIAPELLGQVLEPFVRGEDSRSAETGGAGLGLSIARTIVAAHGGTLSLENRPGGGLRASVRLPLAVRL